MTHVATFVCDPAGAVLDHTLLAAAARLISGTRIRWLAAGIAADIFFQPRHENANVALREFCATRPIDVIVQPAAFRRKKLLLADMDSTMIGQESLNELADFIGKRAEIAAATERAMRGEIALIPALRERVGLLAGLSTEVIGIILAERIGVTPGGEILVKTMRAHGAYTALVTSGFSQFAAPIAEKLGFDTSVANRLLVEDGLLTGALAEPVLDGGAKLATLLHLRAERGLAPAETLAVGDGANDLDMLREAGLGVGYRPKPIIAEKISARLDHADLTALLYAQGYRREEFSV